MSDHTHTLAPYRADGRPGERVAPYCCDVALCDCEPVSSDPVEWIPVATGTAPDGTAYDRCLLCGLVWTHKRYRDSASEIIKDPGRQRQRRAA